MHLLVFITVKLDLMMMVLHHCDIWVCDFRLRWTNTSSSPSDMAGKQRRTLIMKAKSSHWCRKNISTYQG